MLDHCGTDVAWGLGEGLQRETAADWQAARLYEAHAVVKAASAGCEAGCWDLHLLPWVYELEESGRFQASIIVFHMKPRSAGRVTLRSTDPKEAPRVERGFLTRSEDVHTLLEGIELAHAVSAAEPLRTRLGSELSPAATAPERYLHETIRNDFHPAGTCPLDAVVPRNGGVLGVDGLIVADASIMPTIPRANTNLTTAAIAERIAETL